MKKLTIDVDTSSLDICTATRKINSKDSNQLVSKSAIISFLGIKELPVIPSNAQFLNKGKNNLLKKTLWE